MRNELNDDPAGEGTTGTDDDEDELPAALLGFFFVLFELVNAVVENGDLFEFFERFLDAGETFFKSSDSLAKVHEFEIIDSFNKEIVAILK
jgi:hypothetical protein